MRVCDIARGWGVSSSYVARLAKRGMPLSSLAEADSWRTENLKKPPRSESGARAIKFQAEQTPQTEGEDKDSSFARLKRSQRAERMAFELLEELGKGSNAVAMRAGVHAYGESARRASEAELAHAKHQQVTRAWIGMDEMREFISTWFGGIRSLLDAMPSSIAARANPSDPECAKKAIQEGVDQIFITIQKAEGAFS